MGTKATSARGRKRRRDWRPVFLAEFERQGRVTKACEAAGVGRSHVYRERQRTEEFALAWSDVEQQLIDRLEEEGMRRALEGSDRLLEFFLRCRRSSVYGDRRQVEHSGKVTMADLVQLAGDPD